VDSNVKWKIQFDPPNYTNKRPVTFWNDWDGTGWKKVAWEGGIGGASKNTRYFDPSVNNYLMGCCEYDGDGIKDAKYVYPPIDSIQWDTISNDDPPQGSIEVCKRLEVDYDISGEYPITLKNLNTSNNLYQEYEIDFSGGLQDFLKKKLTSISGESIWPITDWNAGKYQEVLMNNFKMVFDNSVYSFYKLPTTNTSTHTTLYTYISKTPELVSGTYNFTWFLKKQKQYVRDIIFNDISLNNINAEYVPRGKVNKVKIILNKPFQSTDVIKISMDSGFTWINISEMFGYNDIDGVWDCTSKLTESSRI
jgi:hypothetical protein